MKMNRKVLALIGGGNMAEALAHGMLRARLFSPSRMRVADVNVLRLKYFKTNFKIAGFRNNAEAVEGADVVVLAVKPAVVPEVLAELKDTLSREVLMISMAAGIRISFIESRLRKGVRVIRVMPNTAALVGKGAAAFCLGRRATRVDAHQVEAMFAAVGVVVRVQEDALDAVTALSGSGPAYVFFLVECMEAAAAKMGLAAGTARTLAVATVEGAAHMLAATGLEPGELRRRVTSKGGTTEAAFRVLHQHQVQNSFVAALRMAQQQSRHLSKKEPGE